MSAKNHTEELRDLIPFAVITTGLSWSPISLLPLLNKARMDSRKNMGLSYFLQGTEIPGFRCPGMVGWIWRLIPIKNVAGVFREKINLNVFRFRASGTIVQPGRICSDYIPLARSGF
jgi:hypothetical protein